MKPATQTREADLQRIIKETKDYGIYMSPERLSKVVSRCNSAYIPICMTKGSNEMIIILQLEDFDDETVWDD